jgi:hypothetical protein
MNCQTFFIIILLLAILACAIYACVYVTMNRKKAEKYSAAPNSPFNAIYQNYINQTWSILSQLTAQPALQIVNSDINTSLVNAGFLDSNTCYYGAFFNSQNLLTLTFQSELFPKPIAYWSLSIYDSNGVISQSWDDNSSVIKNATGPLLFTTNLNLDGSNSIPMTVPEGNFAIIIRFVTTPQTPSIGPANLPQISLPSASIKPNTTNTENLLINVPFQSKDPTQPSISTNSNVLQNKLWQYYGLTLSSTDPTILFPGIDTKNFFLPAKSSIPSIFPICTVNASQPPMENMPRLPSLPPNISYFLNQNSLMVFPSTKKVIRVTGSIPNEIGKNYELRNISFCAGNLASSSTDSSISCYQLPQNYVIYAAYSETVASYYGYNSQQGHKLLTWNPININPVLVFKVLTASPTPIGLATLNNQNNSIDGPTVKDAIPNIYPVAVCFDDNTPLASFVPSLPPIASLQPVEFYSSPEYNPSGMPYIDDNTPLASFAPSLPPIASLQPVEFYRPPEYNPSGMPYIPQVALPSKSMYNLQ